MPEETLPRLKARERGRARRRLRYLREVRELQLRDTGGFVFDLYRFGERRDELVREKLDALIATDREIRHLEALLGAGGQVREIRRAGVGQCAACGELHSTEAKFCAKCGADLKAAAKDARSAPEDGEPAADALPPEPAEDVTIVRTPAVANGNGAVEPAPESAEAAAAKR